MNWTKLITFFIIFGLTLGLSHCQVDLPINTPDEGETVISNQYELVLKVDTPTCKVDAGTWAKAYDRIVNKVEDCLIRFDKRVAVPQHIEYTTNSIRFPASGSWGRLKC